MGNMFLRCLRHYAVQVAIAGTCHRLSGYSPHHRNMLDGVRRCWSSKYVPLITGICLPWLNMLTVVRICSRVDEPRVENRPASGCVRQQDSPCGMILLGHVSINGGGYVHQENEMCHLLVEPYHMFGWLSRPRQHFCQATTAMSANKDGLICHVSIFC